MLNSTDDVVVTGLLFQGARQSFHLRGAPQSSSITVELHEAFTSVGYRAFASVELYGALPPPWSSTELHGGIKQTELTVNSCWRNVGSEIKGNWVCEVMNSSRPNILIGIDLQICFSQI